MTTVYSPAELRGECKRVASELNDIQKRIADTILYLLDGIAIVDLTDEELQNSLDKASMLVLLYHYIPWDDKDKYERIMKILQEGAPTHTKT